MSLSPIVEMQGNTIIACGARAHFEPSQAEISLALRKEKDRPRLMLSARLHGERLNSMDVNTGSTAGSDIFGPSTTLPDGGVERVAEPNSDKATEFLREYFVSGADFRLKTAEGKTISLERAGPAPNSVRAAYLNCAGDFFR
jgi:hypothetical protein